TCGVGRNYLVIDQRGGVAKCQADIKQTVTTIDRDDPLQVIRDDLKGIQSLSVDEKEGCRTCEWRYWCTGGCPLLTYRATGRYDVKSPNCNIYKALFPEVLRLEALRLLQYESPVSLEYAIENL
ncbi:MAG TPA: SPASM domain-containing protein, partial [Ktedonobacteraceae bacterium]